MRSSKILIAGLNGLGAEIAKNVILAGVHLVTFLDYRSVTELDFTSQFFIPRSDLGNNRAEASLLRAQALNPMVEITADTGSLASKDAVFFKGFNVVIILEATTDELVRIDNMCRVNNVKFFAADLWGMFGYSFADLQEHEYVEDVVKHKVISKPFEKTKTEMITSTVKRSLKFPSLESIAEFNFNAPYFAKKMRKSGPAYIVMKILQKFREDETRDPLPSSRGQDIEKLKTIRDELSTVEVVPDSYFQHVFAQISPVAAIVGGAVAQEVIKTVSHKEAPHYNYFFFDAEKSCGFIETVEPITD